MSGFSIEVDDARVNASLRGLSAALRNLRPAMAGIGQALVTTADLSFRGERDPWGSAWARLAASTLRRRRKGPGKGGAKILRDTGRLAGSISYRANATGVTVGTNVVYAAIHQLGGVIEHKSRTGVVYFRQRKDGSVGNKFVRRSRSNFAQDVTIAAHSQTTPARAFLPMRDGRVDLPPDLLQEVLDIVRHHLVARR